MTDQFTTPAPVPASAWGTTPPPAPKKKPWFRKPALMIPLCAVALGIVVGSAVKPTPEPVQVPGPERVVEKPVEKIVEVPTTPESCLTALDLGEQGFTYASESMGYMNDALQAAGKFDVDALNKASADLKLVTPKMEALSPKANAAKAECRAAAK